MALVINNPPGRPGNGSYRFDGKLSYISGDGSRKRRGIKITLGPVDEIKHRDAETIAHNISNLIKSQSHAIPYSAPQLNFIGSLSDAVYGRLASCALVPQRVPDVEIETDLSIEELFKGWKKANSHLAKNSINNHTQAYGSLVRDLSNKKRNPNTNGKDTFLSDITVAFGTSHRGWLLAHGGMPPKDEPEEVKTNKPNTEEQKRPLATATAGKRITWIKQWFTWAIDAELFHGRNPFRKADTSSPSDKSKMCYVSHAQRRELRDAMPTDQLKHIVTLARLQGLRPSDMVMIQVKHVHFGDGTDHDPALVMIPSIKTGNRQCPMFHTEVQEAYQSLTKGKKKKDYLFDRKDFQAVRDGVKTMTDVNIATQVRKYYEAETGKDLWRKPFINMRSACIIELIEIHKYSEYEVSQCVGNSPKTIRKYYMDLLRADHKREAEQELARADTDLVGDNVGDKSSVSPDNTVSHDIPDMVTREEVEQLLEAQKTAILQGLTVSLRTAPDAVKPFRHAIEEMEKVHPRGFEPLTFGSVNRCSIQLS
jgi:integrase